MRLRYFEMRLRYFENKAMMFYLSHSPPRLLQTDPASVRLNYLIYLTNYPSICLPIYLSNYLIYLIYLVYIIYLACLIYLPLCQTSPSPDLLLLRHHHPGPCATASLTVWSPRPRLCQTRAQRLTSCYFVTTILATASMSLWSPPPSDYIQPSA